MQETFALREDFPAGLPHVNQTTYDHPRSLCLTDRPIEELRGTWTSAQYLRLVREWLRLTALGQLHAADQPLEPLIFGLGRVILPNELRQGRSAIGLSSRGRLVWRAVPIADALKDERPLVVAVVRAQPRTHGVIRRTPWTLADLHELLAPRDDVRAQIAVALREWKELGYPLGVDVAIALLVPTRRSDEAEPEVEQPWMFLTSMSIAAMGHALGLWTADAENKTQPTTHPGDSGASVRLLPALAYFDLRRDDAARFNGRAHSDERRFVAIGAGSLGSQVLAAAARAAFGHWTIIDEDLLLPHNAARHALDRRSLGFDKALSMAVTMEESAEDATEHRWITANVLRPGEQREAVEQACAEAVVVVDMSASVPVARAVSRDIESAARRISLFLNPTGTDIVLLAESSDRTIPLDAVEMQYYRAVRTESALAGTLEGAVARERYGRSCRDVSSHLPHARIAALAGIGAQALERVVDEFPAAIRVWRQDVTSLAVSTVDIPVHPVVEREIDGWRMVTDRGLLAKLDAAREAKLPRETGGVLLGHVDVARRIVYIVDTLPSPTDSHERQTLYIRGTTGLREAVEAAQTATGGQLHYIGEWHSHPPGHSPLPSFDDQRVFAWLREMLAEDDLPAVMCILGEGSLAVFVNRMDERRAPVLVAVGPTDRIGARRRGRSRWRWLWG
jgi:integrative and conjugative element protein (TIGR02256 family)